MKFSSETYFANILVEFQRSLFISFGPMRRRYHHQSSSVSISASPSSSMRIHYSHLHSHHDFYKADIFSIKDKLYIIIIVIMMMIRFVQPKLQRRQATHQTSAAASENMAAGFSLSFCV